VASFCTKCGAALSPDATFCTACGAAAGADAATTGAPPAGNYTYAASPVVQPAAPPSSGGGSAVKIILIILGVLVALGVIVASIFAFTIWRVSRAIHVDDKSGSVTVHTPGGGFSTSNTKTYTAEDLGTDIYPGAQNGHGSMKMDLPTVLMVTGVFETTDSKDKVLEYYKGKLGSGASVMDTPETAIVTMAHGQDESVMVTISQKASEDSGKTKIAIVHTKKRK
jgi:zinc-ribbon domain